LHFEGNVTFAGENAASFWYQPMNNMTVAIDTFFVLSGCLLSYRWLKNERSSKNFNIKQVKPWIGFYLQKYLR
jgi:peptidoglycan/LPS O-acetylase OafA/YrhL